MSKLTKLAAVAAVVPILGLSSPALAAGNPGQIEQGDIYRVRNLTVAANGAFSGDFVAATCGDTVQFRVRIHNGGPESLTNVKVSATLNTAKGTSHGSTVSVSADNNLHNAVVTDIAGVNTDKATTMSYVNGSTELLGYSATPGQSPVLGGLPDGILAGGVNIGSIGPLTPDTKSVQFKAKVNCDVTPPTPGDIKVCELSTKKVITIREDQFDANKHTKDLTKCNAPVTPVTPTKLVETGPGDVAVLFAGVAALAAAAYRVVLRRQDAR